MGAGLTIPPVSAAVATDYVRPTADAAPAAVATVLPDVKTVTSTVDTHATPHDVPSAAPAATGSFTQKFTIDPVTRDVIYQYVDARTQLVIQQVPGPALLASRAYSNAIQNGAAPLAAQVQADIAT